MTILLFNCIFAIFSPWDFQMCLFLDLLPLSGGKFSAQGTWANFAIWKIKFPEKWTNLRCGSNEKIRGFELAWQRSSSDWNLKTGFSIFSQCKKFGAGREKLRLLQRENYAESKFTIGPRKLREASVLPRNSSAAPAVDHFWGFRSRDDNTIRQRLKDCNFLY